ncbi:hypothetical protein P5V15_012707 [Pogonomyrmex californicus]
MESISSCHALSLALAILALSLAGSKSTLTDFTHPRFMLPMLDSFKAVCSGHCNQTMPRPFLAILIGPTLTLSKEQSPREETCRRISSAVTESSNPVRVVLSRPANVAPEWEDPAQSSTIRSSPAKRKNR